MTITFTTNGEYTVEYHDGVERARFITPRSAPTIPSSVITQGTYRSLFTFDEQSALYAALPTSIPLQIVLDTLRGSPIVDLTDPRVEFGLGVMVAYHCIAYERIAEILAYKE